jgi:hypothetical protein
MKSKSMVKVRPPYGIGGTLSIRMRHNYLHWQSAIRPRVYWVHVRQPVCVDALRA